MSSELFNKRKGFVFMKREIIKINKDCDCIKRIIKELIADLERIDDNNAGVVK